MCVCSFGIEDFGSRASRFKRNVLFGLSVMFFTWVILKEGVPFYYLAALIYTTTYMPVPIPGTHHNSRGLGQSPDREFKKCRTLKIMIRSLEESPHVLCSSKGLESSEVWLERGGCCNQDAFPKACGERRSVEVGPERCNRKA